MHHANINFIHRSAQALPQPSNTARSPWSLSWLLCIKFIRTLDASKKSCAPLFDIERTEYYTLLRQKANSATVFVSIEMLYSFLGFPASHNSLVDYAALVSIPMLGTYQITELTR